MTAEHRSTIAVVDDDLRVLESIDELLASAGHAVCVFSSAQSLLEGGVLPHIDCLIADVGMPDVDGFELRHLARARRPGLPVIFITARREGADQRRAGAGDHQGFFLKPFDASALLAAVDEALSSST